MDKIKVVSFFSGVGGLDEPFVSDDCFEMVSFCEIDKYASSVLKYHNPNIVNLGDISKVSPRHVKPFNVMLAGFSCKGISTQGKQQGLEHDLTGLVKRLFPIIKKHKPEYVILENVKNLLSKQMEDDYNYITNEINKHGYFHETRLEDSSGYGTNQQRVRAIITFYRKDIKQTREDYLSNVKGKDVKIKSFKRRLPKSNNYVSWSKSTRKEHLDFRIRTDGLINTLTTGSGCVGMSTGTIVIDQEGNERNLTPNECEALQTWKKDFTKYGVHENEVINISDSQRYKMCGNGVTSNIVIKYKEEVKHVISKLNGAI